MFHQGRWAVALYDVSSIDANNICICPEESCILLKPHMPEYVFGGDNDLKTLILRSKIIGGLIEGSPHTVRKSIVRWIIIKRARKQVAENIIITGAWKESENSDIAELV